LTAKASRGGRFVGPADADALDEGDEDGLVDVGLDVSLGDGVVEAAGELVVRSGLVVVTGSSPLRELTHQARASTRTTAAAAIRTQKPVSGVGAPVPGWV
jgi:hypothetical protein